MINWRKILINLSVSVGQVSLLDERPERRVVEVVDVAVGLAPAQVVPQGLVRGIGHGAAVELGRVLELLVGEELRPVVDVGGGEQRGQSL